MVQYKVFGFTIRGARECETREEALRIARAERDNTRGAPVRIEHMATGRVVWRDGAEVV